jgi:hypothetical protein
MAESIYAPHWQRVKDLAPEPVTFACNSDSQDRFTKAVVKQKYEEQLSLKVNLGKLIIKRNFPNPDCCMIQLLPKNFYERI